MSTDERQLEKLLALHCTPVLKDRKVSNMFHIQRDSFDDLSATLSLYNGKLNQKGIHLTMFQQESERVTVFVYRRRRLALLLERKDVQAFLRRFDYPSGPLTAILRHLDRRLRDCKGYPHEIGIFLGYPLHDVEGFIEQRECVLMGYWKVYRYPAAAQRLFALYDACIRELLSGLRRGQCIEQLI